MKKELTDSMIVEALEVLAAEFKWDAVDIWVCRKPQGECLFTAHLPSNEKLCLPFMFGSGATPMEAARDCIRNAGVRDPELMRQKKIRELREQIEKLQTVVCGMPPYRPGTYLANGKAEDAPPVDVAAQVES